MPFTYAAMMTQMATILQDNGNVRWTAPEMKGWIDLALVDIHTMKPNAKVEVVSHPLVAGVKQSLNQQYAMVIRFARNTSGQAIRMLDNLATLDHWQIGWASLPGSATVQFVYHDPRAPRQFTVCPPAAAGASLDMEVGVAPTPAAAPNGADALDMTKYTAAVDIPDQYRGAVLHLALSRAFLKDGDSQAGAAQAQGHEAKGNKIVADIAAGELALLAGAQAGRQAG